MVQKFRENVEIGNKVNFRDKIFVITEKFHDFINTTCDFTPPAFSARLNMIPSRREIPCMEIQSCITGFHVYKEVLNPVRHRKKFLYAPEKTQIFLISLHFAVKVSNSETIVGHLPRSISSVCSLFFFFWKGRSISSAKKHGIQVKTDVYSLIFF